MTKEEVKEARWEAEKKIIKKLEEIREIGRELAEKLGLPEQMLSLSTTQMHANAFSIVTCGDSDNKTVYMLDVTKYHEDGIIKEHGHASFYGEEKGDGD